MVSRKRIEMVMKRKGTGQVAGSTVRWYYSESGQLDNKALKAAGER